MRGWTGIKTLLKRRRRSVIALGSALGHLILFAVVGLQVPELRQMVLPPQQTLNVQMYQPQRLPADQAPQSQRAAQITPRKTTPPPVGVPTLPLAPAPPGVRGGTGGIGVRDAPAPLPAAPGSDLRKALRGFSPGCRMRDAVGLTRAERDACDERLGRGSETATFIAPPMDRAKRAAFDAQAAKDERYRKYREGNVPPGVTPGSEPGKNTGLGDDYAGVRR